MDMSKYVKNKDEKPLDNIALNGGMCRAFRSIACVGDSLSSGEFQLKSIDDTWLYYDRFEYSWGQFIGRMTGAKIYSFSRGGMSAKEYIESFAEKSGFWDKELACQAYIIALGANDLNPKTINCELGDVSDIDINDWKNNKKTFAGYYGAIVQRYKQIQPRAKFFFVSLPNDEARPQCKAQRDLLEKLTNLFDNSYLIDLYTYAPVYDEEFKKEFYLNNHMNPNGYIFTADMIASYVDFIIRNKPEDFEEIAFIGTDITDKKNME